MPRPPKSQQTPNLPEVIKQTAWRQIAEHGAPVLSLRAIARALGITAPAIYNYYPDRDALVAALIIDAYSSFGEAQLAARDSVPASDLVGRLQAIGIAYQQWAITYPERYQLIFGTPIPGYVAPVEQVLPAAARALSALVSVIEALRVAGRLRMNRLPEIHPAYQPMFTHWQRYGGYCDPQSFALAILIWARVHGLVSLEIGHQIPPFGSDGTALYRYELESIQHQLINSEE
ncbi:TetR/AcrR family transcriptional regulator [Chloroflexus sp.]|uniref:TetR/AcrR family transcriptional regulator n=1 Tax=Chloroflexus sp. TaxID=1904827 RepID=UPI00298F1B02|nr:TetR/AcrR family transcriptional regulator [Chloroflexus sp.]MDW8402741.1 TetR/AcrR family transcriptional regulator [Chloroflexus sp.]